MIAKHTFRFYPTPAQETQLAQVFGHTRYVYNWALNLRKEAYANGEKLSTYDCAKLLTQLKCEDDKLWLKDVSCVPLQQSLRHLDKAYTGFFAKRTGFPKFKNRRSKQSASFTKQAFKWDADNRNLTIAKVGRLDVRWSRDIPSYPSSLSLCKTPSGKYFVTLTVEQTILPMEKTGEQIGVDLGITDLAILSNGEKIKNPRHTKKKAPKLAKAQRILSRRQKGSGRWNRQRIKVARIQEDIANARKDHLNKVTTKLVEDFDLIAVEDLNVKGMVKNRKLAKHISDASFGTFVSMLEYKCEWYGKELVKIDRWFPSSKTCSCCGHKLGKLPLSIRKWECPKCEAEHDRDINAARNILAVGCTVTARGESGRPNLASAKDGKTQRNVNLLKDVA